MRAWLVVGLLFSVACKEKPPEPAKQQPATKMPSDEKPPVPAAVAPMMAELDRETKDRPKDTVSVEKVIAGAEAAGVKLKAPPQQVVGSIMFAHFCQMGMTAEGLGMSVCEFDDKAKLEQGEAKSKAFFATMKEREFFVNGKTLLTVNRTIVNDAVTAQRDKVVAMFKGLKAD